MLLSSEFKKFMNNLFDLFNSSSLFGKYSHSPIKSENFSEKSEFIRKSQNILQSLEVKEGKIYKKAILCHRKYAFKGFVCNCEGLLKLYKCLIYPSNSMYHSLLTYKFSQDFIETFFGCRNTAVTNSTL